MNDIKVTFLGLMETGGSKNDIIPSSHPWKIKDFTFKRAENLIKDSQDIKKTESSDLLIALIHLGHDGYEDQANDFCLAQQNSFLISSGIE